MIVKLNSELTTYPKSFMDGIFFSQSFANSKNVVIIAESFDGTFDLPIICNVSCLAISGFNLNLDHVPS